MMFYTHSPKRAECYAEELKFSEETLNPYRVRNRFLLLPQVKTCGYSNLALSGLFCVTRVNTPWLLSTKDANSYFALVVTNI